MDIATINTSNDKKDLIDIYNSLSPPLKVQFLSIARIIESTQMILLEELKKDI